MKIRISATVWFLCTALVIEISSVLIDSAEARDIHIAHCLAGCPESAADSNPLVVREIFTFSANDETKLADWVAYKVTPSTIGTSSSLNRSWKDDEFLDDPQVLERDDYKYAHREVGYDRGHLAPLAAFAGTVYWRATNIISNIAPQKSDMNQGAWRYLETAVRDAAYELGGVYVITGPLYEEPMPELPNADEVHEVPSAYWKVISTPNGRLSAFVMDQDIPRDADYCAYTVSLSEIEERTDLDLFPREPGWPKNSLDAQLGC
ncbi:DNA/RNA non-specific endonuclease [Fodinicurvata halophila]|uniref:Endonuclease n=1 Tax=Fodinicurvata halophila TaxID=1419723 RepID=A0ABV8ULX7_9PROT